MDKLRRNSKGFTAVEGLLVLIFLALIVLIGLYVYHNHHSKSPVVVTTKSMASNSNNYSNVVLSHGFTDSDGFSFEYPTSWEEVNVDNSDPEFAPTAISSQVGQGLLIVTSDTYTGTPQSYLTAQNSNTSGTGDTLALTDNTSMTINGYTANYGVGTNNGGNDYGVYKVFHGGKVAILSFLLSTPTSSDGTAGSNYATYSTDDSAIAHSVQFNN